MIFKSIKLVKALCMVPITAFFMSSSLMTIANAETSTSPTSNEHIEKSAGSHDMMDSMKTGMVSMQNMEMSGDVDKDFAMMMKMHHQQALDMAKMEIAHGKSPEMKAMAKKIMSAQKKEIAQFDKWLAKQK